VSFKCTGTCNYHSYYITGARGCAVGWGTALQVVRSGLTQPLTGMSNRNISWGKDGRCVGLTTSPPSCADCLEIWEPQPSGTLRDCSGL